LLFLLPVWWINMYKVQCALLMVARYQVVLLLIVFPRRESVAAIHCADRKRIRQVIMLSHVDYKSVRRNGRTSLWCRAHQQRSSHDILHSNRITVIVTRKHWTEFRLLWRRHLVNARERSGANDRPTGKGCHCHILYWNVGGVLVCLSPKMKSVTHMQCDARPVVTFPAAERHRPLSGTKLLRSRATAGKKKKFITFRRWVVDDAKCIVVTRVCVSVSVDPDVTWGVVGDAP